MGLKRTGITAWAAMAVCLVVSTAAMAAVTNDREYWFGEDGFEGPSQGAVLGSGNTGGIDTDRTLDSKGPTGAFLDLTQSGDPTYQDVSATGLSTCIAATARIAPAPDPPSVAA